MSTAFEVPDFWAARERPTEPNVKRARMALEWLPVEADSVLDLGCGNGIFINQVSGRLGVGVDRSLAALRYVRVPRCQADARALPFADHSFDVVVAMELIEHLPVPIYPAALAEMARVARCYLLLTVPYREDLTVGHIICPSCGCHFHPSGHVRRFDRPDLERLFSPYGFSPVRIEGIIPREVLRWPRLRRMLARLRGRVGFPQDAVCPQCGYMSPAASSPGPAPRRSGRMKVWGRRLWPRQRTYFWWMALYRRST
ncbi:MAG: class I SAM-dependent methyltransferase [Anaerolineae bacterium]